MALNGQMISFDFDLFMAFSTNVHFAIDATAFWIHLQTDFYGRIFIL